MRESQYIALAAIRERLEDEGFEHLIELAQSGEIELFGRYCADFTQADAPPENLSEIPDGFLASCKWEPKRSRLWRADFVFPGSNEQQHEDYTDVKVSRSAFVAHFDASPYDSVLRSKKRLRGRPTTHDWSELGGILSEVLQEHPSISKNKAIDICLQRASAKGLKEPSVSQTKVQLADIFKHFSK